MGTDKKSALPRVVSGGQGGDNLVLTLQFHLSFVKSFSEIFSSRARIFSSQLYELINYTNLRALRLKGGVYDSFFCRCNFFSRVGKECI